MHAVELIARALEASGDAEALPEPPHDGVCCVTGKPEPCVPRKHLFTKSFTNLDLLVEPASPDVGVAAWTALRHKWERMSSWVCDGHTFTRLDRVGVRGHVLGQVPRPAGEWAGYITTSYKKHGALWAPVNPGGPGPASWRFEGLTVFVDPDEARVVWDRLCAAQLSGLSRPILETLDCPPHVMRGVGAAYWMAFEQWARPLQQGGLYQLLCYLLPSKKELGG